MGHLADLLKNIFINIFYNSFFGITKFTFCPFLSYIREYSGNLVIVIVVLYDTLIIVCYDYNGLQWTTMAYNGHRVL
jgi:hypothetical protein